MKIILSVCIAKILRFLCRILKRGGTGFPGRIALKICPDILEVLSKDVKCIVVTGTNGKTTSVRMIEEAFSQAGKSYFANLAGANLQEGIVTEFIVNSSLGGKCKKEYAILETDEFASKEVCRQIQPEVIFVTNLFVDQVERFGGVKGSFNGIRTAVASTPHSVLVLNCEDSVSSMLASGTENPVIFFGIGKSAAASLNASGTSDVEECVLCDSRLSFEYRTYSHLGGFKCSGCGAKYHEPDCFVSEFKSLGTDKSEYVLCDSGERIDISLNLPALYNIYNSLGVYCVLKKMGIEKNTIVSALSSFKCGFGRMESLPQLGKAGSKMILIKNGAGCDQVIDFLSKIKDKITLAFYLNNNVSDGVDITWLESANFEGLSSCSTDKIYISGMRAQELYDRIVKAGVNPDTLILENDCSKLISDLNASEYPVYILPTYTGMMEARSEIIRQCGGKEFWEETR